MDFKNVDKSYRPIPFWSWNDELSTKETKRQVALMDEAGIGGYFMHARGGLLTEYMGKEWFDNVKAAVDEGRARGMYPWAYDENGWPSGFGGGAVNGRGIEYQQKTVHIEDESLQGHLDTTLLVRDGKRYYYEANEFYVDVLDAKVTQCFLDEIHQKYYDRFGDGIEGFFTDEPQIWRGTGYPYSFILEDKFREKYGYSLIDSLDELFIDKGNYKATRVNYWKLVTELFSENFFKLIYDWCHAHGYKLTGHLVCEENFYSQLTSNGACMPHYEYFDIPGMDWLGRGIGDWLTAHQLGSVAAQTGKKRVLTETYALSGHNVSHNDLKKILEWQMVRGVSQLCTHLEGYTMRGIRKRDYPPAMYYQQPWWSEMGSFFDSMSRIGKLIAEGKVCADTLVIHPQTTAWSMYRGCEGDMSDRYAIEAYCKEYIKMLRELEDKHILFHLGDEIMLERHGKVRGAKIRVGNMKYKRVIVPKHDILLPHTKKLLRDFEKNGGEIVTAEEIKMNPVCDVNRLTYTKRAFPDFNMHYFVNSTDETIEANIYVGTQYLDVDTGEKQDFYGSKHTFAPGESLITISTKEDRLTAHVHKLREVLDISGEWQVKSASENSITLDKCDYYFDGELVEENGYVLNILPRINELRREVQLRQVYRFSAEYIPEDLCLVTETPEIFDIRVNGTPLKQEDVGYFRDTSFRKLRLSGAVVGENVIEFYSCIKQSERTYDHLAKSWGFEAMKNCLSYDMEIEQIYITGSFGARITGEMCELNRDAYRIKDIPVITAPPASVDIEHLDASGYPMFAGEITLTRTFDIKNRYRTLTAIPRGANVLKLSVNGEPLATRMYAPYEIDLAHHLKEGANELEITLVGNLRNNQGPFHLKEGESYVVGPFSFFKESNVFCAASGADESCHDVLNQWHEDYCLVHYGLFLA